MNTSVECCGVVLSCSKRGVKTFVEGLKDFAVTGWGVADTAFANFQTVPLPRFSLKRPGGTS